MFLNALRFKSYGDSENKVWRFNQGTANLAKFICFSEPENVIKDMKYALKFVIGGELNARIQEAALQITDDSGDTWIVERTPERARVVKNGKPIENASLGETLLASLLDLDLDIKTSKSEQAFNFYDLVLDDTALSATLESDHTHPLRKLKGSIETAQETLLTEISKRLNQPMLNDSAIVVKLHQKAEPLFNAYRELLRQRRSLLANAKSLETIDERLVQQLEKELELIGRIELIAQPLLDPANSPKIIKEKLDKVENELKDHLRDALIPESRLPLDEIPWDKLVSCLSKLEAFERLVQASEKAQSLCSNRIGDIQNEYLKTVESLLSSDIQITAELESCLSTLSLQLAAKKMDKKGFGDVVMKFIKPSADVPSDDNDSEKQQRLETARMAVDFALARLGELHANLADARHSFDHLQVSLSEHHETIVHEYGKLKTLWHRLSKEYVIPTELNLAGLLRLCVRYVQLNELHRLKQAYRSSLTERKTSLAKLEELLVSYRQVSGSQKSSPLNNPSILVSEAQAVIRYKQAKQQQLERLKELNDHVRAYHALSANLNGRESQIKAAWKKIFQDIEVPELAPELAGWPEVFALSHQLLAWTKLAALNSKPLASDDVFSEIASDKVFTIYSCISQSTKPSFNLQVAQALDKANLRGFVLVATPDKDLADILTKSGTGSARLLPAAQTSAKTNPAPKVSEHRNDKLHNILDLLNPKRSNQFEKIP